MMTSNKLETFINTLFFSDTTYIEAIKNTNH